MWPVLLSMDRSETSRKPWTGSRVTVGRLDGVDIAADPVPVRRPGVVLLTVGFIDDVSEDSICGVTGRIKMGSNLVAKSGTRKCSQ